MSETTTTKAVNLYQLGQEMGGSPQFRMTGPDEDGVTVIRSTAAQAALDAAVAAHTADPNVKPPPSAQETQDATEGTFIAQQVAARLPKARAILADPTGSPDWTVVERKVLLAVLLIDLAQRRR